MYCTGNYIQYPVISHKGKEYKKECIHVYNSVTELYSRDWHNIVNQLDFNKKEINKICKKWTLNPDSNSRIRASNPNSTTY